MNILTKMFFNIVELFVTTRTEAVQTISSESYCDQKNHHDFYCDAEKPFIQQFR